MGELVFQAGLTLLGLSAIAMVAGLTIGPLDLIPFIALRGALPGGCLMVIGVLWMVWAESD